MKTAVDTSALYALLYPDDRHNRQASTLLGEAYEQGAVVISPPVYIELAAGSGFTSKANLDGFLSDTGIDVEKLSSAARFLAGEAFQEYLSRRGDALQCSKCGERSTFECPSCGDEITARQHVPADFVIGAHAEQQADELVTFDSGFYRDYFEVDVATIGE